MSESLNVFSVFGTISGECGVFPAGTLATFIRLAGCPFKCAWCDTPESLPSDSGNPFTIPEILECVSFPHIVITGGDPLVQQKKLPALTEALHNKFMEARGEAPLIQIETSGLIKPDVIPHVQGYILDYKLVGSEEFNSEKGTTDFWMDMLEPLGAAPKLKPKVFIKYVIKDVADLCQAMQFTRSLHSKLTARLGPTVTYAFSPVHGAMEAKEIVRHLMDSRNSLPRNVMLNMQMHKIIDMA